MPSARLTQVAVDRLRPPAAGRVEHFDKLLPGLALRVSAGGHKSWVLFYRVAGRQRRYTISTLPALPKIDDARDRARELLSDVARGIDPAEAKAAAKKPTAPAPRPDTVASVCRLFVDRYAKAKNKSWAETDRLLQRVVVARWGADRDIATITRRDVLDLLDDLVDRGKPIMANRVLATVRKMGNWAIERGILATSPAAGVKAPGKETERERVLSDDELTLLWRATDHLSQVPAAFFRLAILTGQRRDEIATMRWADLDADRATWTLPRARTKAARAHEVPLPRLAVGIIGGLPRDGEYVLSTTRGDRPISGFSKFKRAAEAEMAKQLTAGGSPPADSAAPIGDWRLHDLRRTCGTGLARLGVPMITISRVLNHAEGGVTKIYVRYAHLDEKREALNRWAAHVEGLIRPPPANVVELRRAGL